MGREVHLGRWHLHGFIADGQVVRNCVDIPLHRRREEGRLRSRAKYQDIVIFDAAGVVAHDALENVEEVVDLDHEGCLHRFAEFDRPRGSVDQPLSVSLPR